MVGRAGAGADGVETRGLPRGRAAGCAAGGTPFEFGRGLFSFFGQASTRPKTIGEKCIMSFSFRRTRFQRLFEAYDVNFRPQLGDSAKSRLDSAKKRMKRLKLS